MKKLGVLVALVLCVTIGGVYAAWLYTGNTYEELVGNHRNNTEYTERILSLVDILVDGRYVEEQKRLGLRFRGSANQRVIDMNKTRSCNKIMIWKGCELDKSYGDDNNEG